MEDIEPYWLPRPPLGDRVAESDLEAAAASVHTADGGWVQPPPGLPVWVFLDRLVHSFGYLLHGSPDPGIEVFEPRTPVDYSPDDFSKQKAVYAAGDGIWPIFYAVVSRPQPGLRFLNSALQFVRHNGATSGMHYFFSVSPGNAMAPLWRNGTVYVLPRKGFSRQPRERLGRHVIEEPHWASPSPVRPLAKVAVVPADFPFMGKVRKHDAAEVDVKALKDPDGYPWL
ncbi:hypothetical protein NNX39_13125 [Arthrobacter sp. zg-Y826]|uniref:hypothetical protein n=1 Tax=Arthrobacter jinronghuae TaxID=2964609 RepID=UPI0021064BB0|nr:hypothetical protein [Arthrobacter jinronghuae]MCQ1957444.1 hypothetical protein [Arthrobacter jinronghuae]